MNQGEDIMEKQIRWIDFLPLALFAYGTRLVGLTTIGDSWATAFYIGGGLAIIQLAYLWYRNLYFDYIALGADLFLIYGALGYAAHNILLFPYDLFKQSVIFMWVFIVGFVTTLASPEGFIQLSEKYQQHIIIGSLSLLGATAVTLLISYCLVTFTNLSTGFGVVLPFVLLLSTREALRNYFIKQS